MPEKKPTGLRAVAVHALRIVEQMTVRVTKALHAVRTELERATPEAKPERRPGKTKPVATKRPRRAVTRSAA
jgi:hypothetical protein